MSALDRAVFHIGRGDQPMADDDRKNRQRAQEIDLAIAFGRRLRRHVARTGPEAFANYASGFGQAVIPLPVRNPS